MKKEKNRRDLVRRRNEVSTLVTIAFGGAGMIAGLVLGITKHRTPIFMQAGGVAGLGVGALWFLAVSGWRKWRAGRKRELN